MAASAKAMELAEAEARLVINSRDFAALVAKADHLFSSQDRRGASAFYNAALRAAQAGQPFDRGEAQRALRHLKSIENGYAAYLDDALHSAGFPRSVWHPRFAKSLATMTGAQPREDTGEAYLRSPTTYFYPDLPYAEFYDCSNVDWAAPVIASSEDIRNEALRLMEGTESFAPYIRTREDRPQNDSHGLLENDEWSTFDLTQKGEPVPDRIKRCPLTWQAISIHAPQCSIPNRAPSVMFSLLKGGARIPAHTGTVNVRLICHLPLIVPGNGALRVGTSVREWRRDELLMFDDTIEHEAWNNANEDRLVLIFDVWHPDLSSEERAQISALFAAVDSY